MKTRSIRIPPDIAELADSLMANDPDIENESQALRKIWRRGASEIAEELSGFAGRTQIEMPKDHAEREAALERMK